jgi:hypothetical protein
MARMISTTRPTSRARREAATTRRAAEQLPLHPLPPVTVAMSQGTQGDGSKTSEDAEDPTPMPLPNLGDPESDDDNDDDGSSNHSSSPNASTHSSNSDQGSGMDDEGEPDLIPMRLKDSEITFEIPFHDKLQSFGLSEPQANLIVQNSATSPNLFLRLSCNLLWILYSRKTNSTT